MRYPSFHFFMLTASSFVNAIIFEGAAPEECSQAYRRAINIDKEKKSRMKINARHTAETKLDYHAWGDKLVSFLG